MHELSIAVSLVQIAQAEARQHGATAVRTVHCRVGVMRQVDPQALADAFELAANGTPVAAARFDVAIDGVDVQCAACGRTIRVPGWAFACPDCGSAQVQWTGGDALEVSLELETPDDD